MIRISDLMNLSESSYGFSGGSAVDMYPHLSLTEATSMLPCVAADARADFIQQSASFNNSLVEAVVYGGDVDYLVEASLSGIIDRIKKFFKKIIDFIKSIIHKIAVFIDKIRMNGKQLVAKYKDKPEINGKDFRGLTFTGYKFKDKIAGEFVGGDANSAETAIKNALNTVIGTVDGVKANPGDYSDVITEFEDADTNPHDSESPMQKLLTAFDDIDNDKLTDELLKTITGESDLSYNTYVSEIAKRLRGDSESKVELKANDDFTASDIMNRLSNPEDLDKMKREYETTLKAYGKHDKDLNSEIKKLERLSSGIKSDDNAGRTSKQALSDIVSYLNKYMSVTSTATTIITNVKQVKTTAIQDRVKQDTAIFKKMLSFKGKKDNNDFEFDTDLDFDL